MLGSNLCRATGNPDWRLSWYFSARLDKFRDSSSVKPLPLPSRYFPIHQSFYYSTLYDLNTDSVLSKPHKEIHLSLWLSKLQGNVQESAGLTSVLDGGEWSVSRSGGWSITPWGVISHVHLAEDSIGGRIDLGHVKKRKISWLQGDSNSNYTAIS
jgi:hypothetical protein